MQIERDLLKKFEKIERLFIGAKTSGEKKAAANAMERIKERLAEFKKDEPSTEFRFTFSDMWSRRLFVSLLRRYGIEGYRYHRQRYTTVMAKVPRQFIDDILMPEFKEFNEILREHIDGITNDIISKAIFKDTSEVRVKSGREIG